MYLSDMDIEVELTHAFQSFFEQQTTTFDKLKELLLHGKLIPEVHEKIVLRIEEANSLDLKDRESWEAFGRLHYTVKLRKASELNYSVFLRTLSDFLDKRPLTIYPKVSDLRILSDYMEIVAEKVRYRQDFQINKTRLIAKQLLLVSVGWADKPSISYQ